jgi:ABC-type sugar transport system substrate-binding protein
MRTLLSGRWTRAACVITVGIAVAGASVAYASSQNEIGPGPVPALVGHPTKALCKKKSYKIGFETYSETDPFAVSVNNAIAALAKQLGCVTIVMTNDNADGPTAVTNTQTMLNEGIQGLINWNTVASAQTAIAADVAKANVPTIESSGAYEKNAPNVGLGHYQAGYAGGEALGQAALKMDPSVKQPYLVYTTDPTGGVDQLQDGQGDVAGFKKYFPNDPASHIIQVPTDAMTDTAYSGTLSALSKVPAGSLVLMTGTDTDTNYGSYEAAVARHLTNFLVEEETGSGFADVCKYKQWIGSIDFNPPGWANYMLPAIMEEMNGVKLPATVPILPVARTKAYACAHK